jgi:hypothetical protein
MKEAPENGKESSNSAHANGMSDYYNKYLRYETAKLLTVRAYSCTVSSGSPHNGR